MDELKKVVKGEMPPKPQQPPTQEEIERQKAKAEQLRRPPIGGVRG
jgi:hypothetical protein